MHPTSLRTLCLLLAGCAIFTTGLSAQTPAAPPERPAPEQRLQAAQSAPPRADAPKIVVPASEDRAAPEERLMLLAQNAPAPSGPAQAPAAAPAQPPAAPQAPAPAAGQQQSPAGSDATPPAGGPPGDGQRPRGPGGPGGGFGGRRPGGGFGGGGFGGPGGGFGPGGGATAESGEETFRIEGDQVMLMFANNPVTDILSIYERLTDKTLVKDTNIFEGATISLVTPKPVARDEAVRLIEAALLTNGYAIVADPGGKSAKILPTRGQGVTSMQFSAGVRFFTTPDDLPTGETLVTYFMKLDFLDPTEASEILANHVGLNVYGRITPVLTPPGLLITESATIVRQLIDIRNSIDVGATGSSLVTKFIALKFADAATVAQIVQATISAQATERETKGIKTVRGEAQPGGRSGDGNRDQGSGSSSRSGGGGGGEERRSPQPIFYNGQWVYPPSGDSALGPTSQVVADTRLNQILVVATPDDFTYISSLITEFDKPVTVEEPYERKMKYASAVDVLPALADLLKDVSTGSTQLPGGGSLQGASNQALVSTSRSQVLAGRSTTTSRGGTVASSLNTGTSADGTGTTTSGGIGSRPDVIQGPQEDNAPVSLLVNKTRLIADPMANSIIVIGSKEDVNKVDSLLDKLDRKPAQVYLATVIGQLTLGDGFEFGVDYLSSFQRGGSDAGLAASSIFARDDIITNNNISDLRDNLITSAFGPARSLNIYGQLGDSLEMFVTALESTNKFKVLSRPSIFALNNKKATITSGRQIPVPSQSVTVPGNVNNSGTVTTTVEYRDVVLKLEVVPLINADGEVSLTIAQVNDTVIGTQRVEPNDVPIIGTEQLITSVNVPTGNTVVLGGLISEEKKKDTTGMPFISRVPLVGNLFKDTSDTSTRKELIVFIQPLVVTDDNSLKSASYSEDIRTKVGSDAAKRFPQKPEPPKIKAEEPEKKPGFFKRLFSRPGQNPLRD